MKTVAIILAAGKGTRMKSDLPKCLHLVAGAPMALHVIRLARRFGAERIGMVIGHGGDKMKSVISRHDEDIEFFWQHEQKGTGHAVQMAEDLLKDPEAIAIMLFGDTPLVQEDTVTELAQKSFSINGPTVLGFECDFENRYGRLLTKDDALLAIRETKDASDAELEITLCNSGVIACPAGKLQSYLGQLSDNNAAGEVYLTDIIEIARQSGDEAGFIRCNIRETLGVNTPADLAAANIAFQKLTRETLLAQGVAMPAPDTVVFAWDTEIGTGSVIEPYTVFANNVTVESGAVIRAFSHLEGAHVGEGAQIGPYARLRPGSEIGADVKIGNFVETKNAVFAQGAKANHLSYIGDAEIGANANIGAGVITANYDGVFKHKTVIGENGFIGSNSVLIAPINVGNDALVGSGSIVSQDIPEGDLALGRAKQVNKPGMGRKLMNRLRAIKAKKTH